MGICGQDSKRKELPKRIENEDNEIVDLFQIKQIMISDIDKSVCKIITKTKTGTGFFCDVPEKNIKFLIKNNHIIDEQFLENENKLVYSISEMKNGEYKDIYKEINLIKDR